MGEKGINNFQTVIHKEGPVLHFIYFLSFKGLLNIKQLKPKVAFHLLVPDAAEIRQLSKARCR